MNSLRYDEVPPIIGHMHKVSKETFYREIQNWKFRDLNPVQLKLGTWRCQKSDKLFGFTQINSIGKMEYFLNKEDN